MNVRHAVLAAVVVAAAAVSACSNSATPKPWADVTPSPVGATVAAPQFVWQDVTGQGRTAPRDSNPKSLAQYGSTPVPGIQVQHVEYGEMHVCTVGPAVVSTSGQPGFLTAGHCSTVEGGPQQWMQPTPDGDPTPLATATGSGEAVPVWTAAVPASATRIADTWDVAGVLTAKGVAQLVPLGSTVCIDGAVSGVRCGKRVADEDGMVAYAIPTKKGDSGAPVFVVDSATHRAALIGIHQAGDGTRGGATLIDPALLATGAAAKFASGVDPFDAAQLDLFSLRFSQ
ncbi:hypothetical protein PJI74_01340 [Mycobacterium kansasii]